MKMRETTYTDPTGRKWAVLLPENAGDEHAYMGIVVGPQPLDDLRLPPTYAIRLHNELFARRIFTSADARRQPGDVARALVSAARVGALEVITAFEQAEAMAEAAIAPDPLPEPAASADGADGDPRESQ